MAAASLTDASAGLPMLEGRVAVVTGAGGGTGRACAELLARLGASVGVLDRSRARATAVATAIESAGGAAEPLVADVSRPEQVAAAAQALEARFGACDALVNCAVAAPEAPLEELEVGAWDRATAVNLGGPFTCLREFGRAMLARRNGSVVNVVPAAAPRAGAAAATAAAAGGTMLARLGAVEWGNRGVRVNAVETAAAARPEAVAAAVAFLAGDGSGYVSGESFEVNEEV